MHSNDETCGLCEPTGQTEHEIRWMRRGVYVGVTLIVALILLIGVGALAAAAQNTDSAGDLPLVQGGDGVGVTEWTECIGEGVLFYVLPLTYHDTNAVLVIVVPALPDLCFVSVNNGPLSVLPLAVMGKLDGGDQPATVGSGTCWGIPNEGVGPSIVSGPISGSGDSLDVAVAMFAAKVHAVQELGAVPVPCGNG